MKRYEDFNLDNLADYINIIFKSDQGKIVLEYIAKQCALSHLNSNQFMDMNVQLTPDQYMFLREGQDSVLRFILRMIEHSEEGKLIGGDSPSNIDEG